jgi:hypothetical protein
MAEVEISKTNKFKQRYRIPAQRYSNLMID